MQDLQIKPISSVGLAEYEPWFDNRSASDILFKQPGHSTVAGRDLQAWSGVKDGEVVGVVIFHIDADNQGHLDFAVKPSERRKGIGYSMVALVTNEPTVRKVSKIHVSVGPENTAGQKILESKGFAHAGTTPEGYFNFEKRF